ncbi:MAG: hypothetical protein KDK26_04495 [Roseivivax sp.]|nr:hypothetical protein [Roseivivax sp.]
MSRSPAMSAGQRQPHRFTPKLRLRSVYLSHRTPPDSSFGALHFSRASPDKCNPLKESCGKTFGPANCTLAMLALQQQIEEANFMRLKLAMIPLAIFVCNSALAEFIIVEIEDYEAHLMKLGTPFLGEVAGSIQVSPPKILINEGDKIPRTPILGYQVAQFHLRLELNGFIGTPDGFTQPYSGVNEVTFICTLPNSCLEDSSKRSDVSAMTVDEKIDKLMYKNNGKPIDATAYKCVMDKCAQSVEAFSSPRKVLTFISPNGELPRNLYDIHFTNEWLDPDEKTVSGFEECLSDTKCIQGISRK